MMKNTLKSVMWVFTVVCLSAAIQAQAARGSLTQETQAAITPALALKMLKDGNERFVGGNAIEFDDLAEIKRTAGGQYPLAAVVSCIDSRIPPEFVFDQGIGDLFVARIAGNFVNDDILGSLEFATKVSGARIIVIMGHTECGAIRGACDEVDLGLLTATLANINPAVAAVRGDFTKRNSNDAKFVQAVAEENVRLTMQMLRDRSVVLRRMIDAGELGLVGAMYDVSSGKVAFIEYGG
jgi:carbonic anhydrase